MNYICHGFLDAVSEEAEILFPPSSRGKPGKENFNVQRFAKGALAGDPKRWRTLRESPSLLRLDEAQAMADTLHRPLVELIVKAQDKARKYQTDQNFLGNSG